MENNKIPGGNVSIMELVKGRPIDVTDRLDKEIRTYDLLDSLGIEYERVDHEAAETMEACAEIDVLLEPAVICKNLFLLKLILHLETIYI